MPPSPLLRGGRVNRSHSGELCWNETGRITTQHPKSWMALLLSAFPQRSCHDCSRSLKRGHVCAGNEDPRSTSHLRAIVVSPEIHQLRQSQRKSPLDHPDITRYHSLMLSRLMDDLSDEHRAKRDTRDAVHTIYYLLSQLSTARQHKAKRFELHMIEAERNRDGEQHLLR